MRVSRSATPGHSAIERSNLDVHGSTGEATRRTRVAIVVSHPIQHFCPQYSSWARLGGVDIMVYFASRSGLDAYEDKNFGRLVKWEGLVLNFPHEFLSGADARKVDRRIDSVDLPARLSEFSPDLVVVYGYAQPLQRRAVKWARSHARPLAMIADSELRTRRPLSRRSLKAVILPRLLGQVDLFLTVGDANEEYYRRYGVPAGKFVRCPFPIDVDAFAERQVGRSHARDQVRHELGIPADDTIVLMVGKLVSWKRQEDLLEFSRTANLISRSVTVILAGTGPYEERLRAGAERIGPGGVIFAGFVPPARLVQLYAAADVYAHCSETEPHSLAISEAVYSGLPVVLSDRCGSHGPTDDVQVGRNGLVYPCGNPNRMSTALFTLIDDPSLMESMRQESERIGWANQALAHGEALVQAIQRLGLG